MWSKAPLIQRLLRELPQKTQTTLRSLFQGLQIEMLPIRNDDFLGVQSEAEDRTHEAESVGSKKSRHRGRHRRREHC